MSIESASQFLEATSFTGMVLSLFVKECPKYLPIIITFVILLNAFYLFIFVLKVEEHCCLFHREMVSLKWRNFHRVISRGVVSAGGQEGVIPKI